MARPRKAIPTFQIFLREGVFYFRFWANGINWRLSCRTKDRIEAETIVGNFAKDFRKEDWLRPNVARSMRKEKRTPASGAFLETARAALLSESEISSTRAMVLAACGVYFLIKNGKIVYIGQATNIFRRVGEHVGIKDFDSWSFVLTSERDLDVIERAYIDKFLPELNSDSETMRLKNAISTPASLPARSLPA